MITNPNPTIALNEIINLYYVFLRVGDVLDEPCDKQEEKKTIAQKELVSRPTLVLLQARLYVNQSELS